MMTFIIYSTCGVFPSPPTDKFPTDIIGISNDCDEKKPISKSLLRMKVIRLYINDNGSNIKCILQR